MMALCIYYTSLGLNVSGLFTCDVGSLGWEDPPKQEIVTQSSILSWEIPWPEEAGGLQSMGPQ